VAVATEALKFGKFFLKSRAKHQNCLVNSFTVKLDSQEKASKG
jgi:hypothetical protein